MSSGSEPPVPQNPSPFSTPPTMTPQAAPKSNTALILIVCAVVAMMMLLCGGVLVALLLPAVQAARQAAMRMQRSNNVKEIGIAIHNYHAAYRQLPCTIVTDSTDHARLGWRLAISPFVEGQTQWERLQKDESWDSETNLMLVQDPPIAFQAPTGDVGETNVFAVIDPASMFPPSPMTKVQFRDVTDGLSNTLMLIELPNRSVPWTSVDNLTPDEAFAALKELQAPEVAHVLMADGAVRAITSDIDRASFDAFISRSGGD